jgi:cytidylate kinase
MYRAITWLALERGVGVDDEAALGALAEDYPVQLADPEADRVKIGGYSLGPQLRASAVNAQVSTVSRVPAVRRAMVRRQRLLAAEGNIVMMGRDIGTVVLPGADLKVFLSASPEERANRRWKELQAQGRQVEFQQVLEEAEARDHVDSHRADSPLAPAHDAFLLDTDGLTLEQVVEQILERIHRLAETAGA